MLNIIYPIFVNFLYFGYKFSFLDKIFNKKALNQKGLRANNILSGTGVNNSFFERYNEK